MKFELLIMSKISTEHKGLYMKIQKRSSQLDCLHNKIKYPIPRISAYIIWTGYQITSWNPNRELGSMLAIFGMILVVNFFVKSFGLYYELVSRITIFRNIAKLNPELQKESWLGTNYYIFAINDCDGDIMENTVYIPRNKALYELLGYVLVYNCHFPPNGA